MVSHAPEINGMPGWFHPLFIQISSIPSFNPYILIMSWDIGVFCRFLIKKTDVGRVISEAISISFRIVWTYSVKGERRGDIYIVGPGQGVCLTVRGLMLAVDSG